MLGMGSKSKQFKDPAVKYKAMDSETEEMTLLENIAGYTHTHTHTHTQNTPS
jgi:hypothetical protein